jgi:hypothetical protein
MGGWGDEVDEVDGWMGWEGRVVDFEVFLRCFSGGISGGFQGEMVPLFLHVVFWGVRKRLENRSF